MTIEVTSSAFKEGEAIPAKYTCDGENISPPLSWSGIPEKTKSIALIADDPDAPGKTWVHWVLFNLPPDTTSLEENIPGDKELKNGSKQGVTDFGDHGYGGPCPPGGTHRYNFKIYALDEVIEHSSNIKKQDLIDTMDGHILEEGQLMGKYSR